MKGPLDGIKIVEWSTWGIGPMAGAILSDMGAQIIKVEAPEVGDPARHMKWVVGVVDSELPKGRNALFEIMNRNKRAITLNLKHPEAKEILCRLVADADVFLENFRPGVADRLGVGYQALSQINPRLIYASSSGYGFKGPDAHRPGLDYVGQARSGFMWAMGHPGDPPYWSSAGVADVMGGIMLAFGVLGAITARERHGIGQKVEMSHLSATMFLQYWSLGTTLLTGTKEWPRFDRRTAGNPLWNHYQCGDGEWIALALLQPDRYWKDFCGVLGVEHLVDDPRFCDEEQRRVNASELIQILDKVFTTKPRAEWERLLGENPDFLYERVQTIAELAEDPQVIANEYLSDFLHPDLGTVKVVNFPVRLTETPARVRSAAPQLGEHTDEVLSQELGLAAERIDELRRQGAI